MRKFNTAGPIRPALDYHIPPLDRLDLPEVLELIRDERYFVLHAPRQTGKTSTLLALRGLLNSGKAGKYRCAYINVEPAQTAREDVGRAMGAIASQVAREARYTLNDAATAEAAERMDTTRRPDDALGALLETWARAAKAPLVLLVDEIDAMVADSLVSVLRQLRTGYVRRPDGFPQSVVLCGVRDVRDYRIEPLLAGGDAEYGERDFEYVRDLGLVGSRRVDLLVVWPRERGQEDRIVVECKLVREGRSLSRTVDEGLEQTRRYMDISGTDEGHLVVFDMRPDRSWAERVFREERDRRGARLMVWGA